MAVLGLCFCARAFSSCGKRGPLFIAVRGPLTIAASPIAEHRLQTRRLSSCGSQAQLLRGMWDLPRPGLEPVSPALAGRFSTTAPPGKPEIPHFWRKSPTTPFVVNCSLANLSYWLLNREFHGCVTITSGRVFPHSFWRSVPRETWEYNSGEKLEEEVTPEQLRTTATSSGWPEISRSFEQVSLFPSISRTRVPLPLSENRHLLCSSRGGS